MFSSFIPDILKPVSVMCGLGRASESTSTSLGYNTTTPSAAEKLPANKPVTRCISQITACASTDDSTISNGESVSDEEICARMASLGRIARKAGRHVLVGDKLVLS